MDANTKQLCEIGYCVSPNNINNLKGHRMYPAGPGILEPHSPRYEVWVDETGVYLMQDIYVAESFPNAAAFISWLQDDENGNPSDPGLPAFSNSWD